MPDQNVPNRVIEHGIVGWQDGSTRIPENGVYPLVNKAFPDDLSASALARHVAQSALPGLYQSN
jgi:hypothetical protein